MVDTYRRNNRLVENQEGNPVAVVENPVAVVENPVAVVENPVGNPAETLVENPESLRLVSAARRMEVDQKRVRIPPVHS